MLKISRKAWVTLGNPVSEENKTKKQIKQTNLPFYHPLGKDMVLAALDLLTQRNKLRQGDLRVLLKDRGLILVLSQGLIWPNWF